MVKTSLQSALHMTTLEKEKPVDWIATERRLKKLIVEIPVEAHHQIDQMRLDLRRNSIKELVTEALNDLFKKHNYPTIA